MKMEGHLFSNPDDYIYKCTALKFDRKLNLEKNLARVYQYATLRDLAERLGFPIGKFEEDCKKKKVVKLQKNYKLAQKLDDRYHSRISEYLREVEYDLSFPLITYFRFPDLDHLKSRADFLAFLEGLGFSFTKGECVVADGIKKPHGRYPSVESIKDDSENNIVAIIYSCTRTLFNPDTKSHSVADTFLARIPIVVKFIFDRNLIEVSMPYYFEQYANKFDEEGKYPQRLQEVFRIMSGIIEKLIKGNLKSIDYDNFSLYLEFKCDSVDMGWQIEPQDSATFNARQNVVPMKEIFEEFESALCSKCEQLGKENPLGNVKLYNLFRAIKEAGHTLQLIYSIPFAQRGGQFKFFLIYGSKDSDYPPIIRIEKYNSFIIEKLRLEVWTSLQIKKMDNPYSLNALLAKDDPNESSCHSIS